MPEEHVNAFDDLTAEIHCLVHAYPQPQIIWTYRKNVNSVVAQKLIDELMVVNEIGPNKYESILTLRNATGRDGVYTCEVSSGGMDVSGDAQLSVVKAALPLTPRFVLQ
ncbi:unnamed protein product, partial [Anisakis simplex]|uniref:Ig-like domain-containing protein n=1 Tax=Anisakis simplex TaxID=6269 RepID=A0A0M3JP26_ANISI